MKRMEPRGRWVLVTGASSGLGREMCRVLARDHGANLVLTARRQARLEALAAELRAKHHVDAVTVPADLARAEDVDRLFEESTAARAVYGVILNAGVTYYGHHLDMPWPTFETLVATNVTSLVRLAGRFVPYLEARGEGGGVMLVASLAGFLPVPYQAAYGGTKAFVASFGQALAGEIRGGRVSLTVFAPGGIATELLEKSGLDRKFDADHPGNMPADRCARLAVAAFLRRQTVSVPGFGNRLTLFLLRVLPRRWMNAVTERLYRPPCTRHG